MTTWRPTRPTVAFPKKIYDDFTPVRGNALLHALHDHCGWVRTADAGGRYRHTDRTREN
jgi:hypothetical protein